MNGLTIGSLLISRSLKDRYKKQINRGVIEQNQKKKMSSYSEKKSSCEKESDANIRRNEELLRRFGKFLRKMKPTSQQKKEYFAANPTQVPCAPGLLVPCAPRFVDKEISQRKKGEEYLRKREDVILIEEVTKEFETLSIERSRRHLKPVDYSDEELTTEDCYIYSVECDELHFGNCPVDGELESLDETEMKTDSMSTIPIPKQLSSKVSSIPNAGLGNPGEELLVYYGDSCAKQLGIDKLESNDGNKEEKAIPKSPVRRTAYRTQIEKPFKCQLCSCSYQHKSYLTSHTRLHTGVNLHMCNFCQKKFINESKLTIHTRTHTGEKPFECLTCKKRFNTSSDLIVHIRTHTGEKPFECRICNKRFAVSSNRNKHERTHKANH